MEQPFDVKTWYREARESRDHYDSGVALRCLKTWDAAMATLEVELKSNLALSRDLERLRKELQFVAFPELPLEEAKMMLQSQFKEFLLSEIDIKDALSKRYIFAGYGQSERERKIFKEAVLKNTEQIGNVFISDWFQIFDKAFDSETRDDASVTKFFRQNQQVADLNKNEQIILRHLLEVYDYFIASELLNIIDLAVLYSQADQLSGGQAAVSNYRTNTVNQSQSAQGSSSATTSLPLLQALSKYENLGNQLITEERIKVKSQPEPVRPSLLYWLKYYRDELGIGQHSSVERGDFLFRSENCRKLSAEERERVSLILKSVEEDLPLSIDLERQEIIFPVFRDVVLARPDTVASGSDTRSVSGGMMANNVLSVRNTPVGGITGEPAFAWSPPAAPPASMIPRNEPVRVPGGFTSPAAEQNELPRAKTIGTPVFFVPKPEESEVHSAQVESADSNMPHRNENRTGQAFGASEVSFSTGHVFPAEKEAAENRAVATKNATAPPTEPRPVPQKFNSFRISPVSLGGKDQYEQNHE